jgi:hypothetical protein
MILESERSGWTITLSRESLSDRETCLAVDPAEVPLEAAGDGHGEELGDFIRVKLRKRAAESFDASGARLQ